VRVLDQEHRRGAGGQLAERLDGAREHELQVGVGGRALGAGAGVESLTQAVELRRRLLEARQNVPKDGVRDAAVELVGPPDQRAVPDALGALEHLGREPRLPDAGLAPDEH
jgi:hypothetical protein